jgi:hypothetical protein
MRQNKTKIEEEEVTKKETRGGRPFFKGFMFKSGCRTESHKPAAS